VAIIMDGNGRWARGRGMPRLEGHRAGADAVRRVVEAAPGLGIGTLTLHAFSCDNWRRPAEEVDTLMGLFGKYLTAEISNCAENGVRLSVIGRRDRLGPKLLAAIASAEAATAYGDKLHLRLAIDYSARDSIARAAERFAQLGGGGSEQFAMALADAIHADPDAPDVDLLIRTGGESRLSDLLGWDSAYAELLFHRRMWPEFDGSDLRAAVEVFRSRERRFGGLPETDSGTLDHRVNTSNGITPISVGI
jgi:undecaprenyl diphosphate synthase